MKDILGYEGLYAATEDGKIWSYKSKKYMKPQLGAHGYYLLTLYKKGASKKKHVHQWVCLAFIGPSNGLDVNHINSIKTDNRITNLEYITRKQNIHHAILNGTNKIRGEQSKKAKIKEKDAKLIKYGLRWLSNKDIAKIYNISSTAVYLIRKGKNWANV